MVENSEYVEDKYLTNLYMIIGIRHALISIKNFNIDKINRSLASTKGQK